MTTVSYGFPAAGINETDGRKGYDLARSTVMRPSDSTPSLIVDENGGIVAQTFERTGEVDNVRVAEMWHRAKLLASMPAMLDLLHRNLNKWEDEEESVQEEHHELITDLRKYLGRE